MKNFYQILLLLIVITFIGCSSDSEESDPLKTDSTPPSVSLSFAGIPDASSGSPIIVSNQIEISINAQDANGISKVEAFLDGNKVGEDSSAPFSIIIDLSGLDSRMSTGKYKDYLLEVVVTDRAGNTTTVDQILNVDNELPVITEVSLIAEAVLSGADNPITFEVTDNEGLAAVSIFINDELLEEFSPLGPFETTIDTSILPDGPSILRIEAVDLADNMATYEVEFISDNLGPEIVFEQLQEGQIIDQAVTINPTVSDAYSEVDFVEILFNESSLIVVDGGGDVLLDFNPEEFAAGNGTFEITAVDVLGNSSTLSLSAEIHRRLIEINIPENWMSPYVTAGVVFLSRMDGSVITWEEILPEDRQFLLSVPEEFDAQTEFMLSFYLQDNGGATSLSTHQNLTRSSPGTLNLKVPPRRDGTGSNVQVPSVNFLSNDVLIGEAITSYSFFTSGDDSPASYTVFLDTTEDFLNIATAADPVAANPFDQVYVFNLQTFSNIVIDNPVPDGFVIDKGNMTSDNLQNRQLQVSSATALADTRSVFRIAGAFSPEDEAANKLHEMFVWNRIGNLDSPMDYMINTDFSSYRHALQFGKYFTERKGEPLASYTIPDLDVDFSVVNNQINLVIQGTEHSVARAESFADGTQAYVWSFTFDSNHPEPIVIPDLPVSISHRVATDQQAGNIEVQKVELLSYDNLPTYDSYIESVWKNQVNIFQVTDAYHLVYKSTTGNFNVPIRDFFFN